MPSSTGTPVPPPVPELTDAQREAIARRQEALDAIADLRHYTKQINLIFRPVMVCMFLVIWWVKVEQQVDALDVSCVPSLAFCCTTPLHPITTKKKNTSSVGLIFNNNVTTGNAISDGLVNALIIIAVVIVITIVFVILFIKGYIKFLFGYLIVATGLLLGGTGGLFMWLQCTALNIPIDFISLVVSCWNFACLGLTSIFWHSPLMLRQVYLILVSALLVRPPP